MDTLIALSTTLAYLFSVGIIIAVIVLESVNADEVLKEPFFSSRYLPHTAWT